MAQHASSGRQRRTVTAGVAAAGVLSLAAGGCTATTVAASHHARRAPVSAAQVSITPAASSTHANPSRGVTVSVSRGTLKFVSVTRSSDPVSGTFNQLRTAWHTTWPLLPSHTYTVVATAVDARHRAITTTSTFRTVRPRHTFLTQLIEGYHQAYGVGMPIILTFSHPVRPKYRAAVERSIQLWTSKPVVGAWYWDDAMMPTGTSLVFRPRDYWPQHTRVRMVAHFAGLEVAPGVYGRENLTQSWRIGNSLIAVVDTAAHYARIYYKQKLFGNWPVSTGAPATTPRTATT